MPDSSTGGYLAPSSVNGDLNDQALNRFLQQVVVGITGLTGNLVFPRWQQEPPNIPDNATNWAAVGKVKRWRDPAAAVIHSPSTGTGVASSSVVRSQIIDILCSFYGPNAEANSELLSMGLMLPQNREAMQLAGYALVQAPGESIVAPALIKNRWTYKIDIPFSVRSQQIYTYSVLDLQGAEVTIMVDDGQDETMNEQIQVKVGFDENGFGQTPFGE